MKEKELEEIRCENCIHHFACRLNGEYDPSPCRAYEDKADYIRIDVEERTKPGISDVEIIVKEDVKDIPFPSPCSTIGVKFFYNGAQYGKYMAVSDLHPEGTLVAEVASAIINNLLFKIQKNAIV